MKYRGKYKLVFECSLDIDGKGLTIAQAKENLKLEAMKFYRSLLTAFEYPSLEISAMKLENLEVTGIKAEKEFNADA